MQNASKLFAFAGFVVGDGLLSQSIKPSSLDILLELTVPRGGVETFKPAPKGR